MMRQSQSHGNAFYMFVYAEFELWRGLIQLYPFASLYNHIIICKNGDDVEGEKVFYVN